MDEQQADGGEAPWMPEPVAPTALELNERLTIQVLAGLVFLGGTFLPYLTLQDGGPRNIWEYSPVGALLFLVPALLSMLGSTLGPLGRLGRRSDPAVSLNALFALIAAVGLVLPFVLGMSSELAGGRGFSVGAGLIVMMIAGILFIGALVTPTPADREREKPSVLELAQRELDDRDRWLAATNAKRRARGKRELTAEEVFGDQARSDASRSSNS